MNKPRYISQHDFHQKEAGLFRKKELIGEVSESDGKKWYYAYSDKNGDHFHDRPIPKSTLEKV